MAKQANFVGLMLLCGCALFLESAAYPADIPPNPVQYRRTVRHRPSAKHPELEVYEVREIFVVRRPTPPTKKIKQLNDIEMEERILCDFQPTLPNCAKFRTNPVSSWRNDRLPTFTSRRTTTTTDATTTSSTSTTTTTTAAPTTSDLPFLPELPSLPDGSPELTTVANEEKDYEQKEDTYDINYDEQDNEDVADDTENETDLDSTDYLNPSGSIGGNDMTK